MQYRGGFAGLILCLSITATVAQDVPKIDTASKIGVLCDRTIIIAISAVAEYCHWDRTPAADAIEDALADVNAFIVANSSTPVTQKQLEERNATELKQTVDAFSVWPDICSPAGDPSSFMAYIRERYFTGDPAKIRAATKELLSVPREPLMEPCLSGM